MNATKQERGMSRKVADLEALLEKERLWGRINRQDIADLEAECERLRGLLTTARSGLQVALSFVTAENETSGTSRAVISALRRSDPDAQPEQVNDAD